MQNSAIISDFFNLHEKRKKSVIASERNARNVAIHYARSAFFMRKFTPRKSKRSSAKPPKAKLNLVKPNLIRQKSQTKLKFNPAKTKLNSVKPNLVRQKPSQIKFSQAKLKFNLAKKPSLNSTDKSRAKFSQISRIHSQSQVKPSQIPAKPRFAR